MLRRALPALAALAVLAAGCGGDEENATSAPEPVDGGYVKLAWASTELMDRQRLLREEGVQARFRVVATPNDIVTGFARGDIQFAPQSVGIAGNMLQRGIELKIVSAGLGVYGQVVVPRGSPIRDLRDLAGKRIASSTGTSTHAFMVALIERAEGIDLAEQAEIVNAATPPDLANLLESGEVDASIAWTPLADRLTASGRYRVVATQQGLWEEALGRKDEMIHIVYIAQPGLLERDPQFAAKLTRAQQKVARLWRSEPETVIRTMAAVNGIPEPVARHAYENGPPALAGLSAQQRDQIRRQLELLNEVGYFEPKLDLARLRDVFVSAGGEG